MHRMQPFHLTKPPVRPLFAALRCRGLIRGPIQGASPSCCYPRCSALAPSFPP